MQAETRIKLNQFQPRQYQKKIIDALLNKDVKRVMALWPRRAGKDLVGLQLALRMALKKVGTIFYVFPTFASGRRILWDAITIDGKRLLSYIPEELIESKNEQGMRIRFKNQSVIQVVGSDNSDVLVGTNCTGIIFSEYALQDPQAYLLSIPILKASNAWALFLSTPRGKNHMWELYQIALHNPEIWTVDKLTVDETQHISMHDIESLRATGEMSDDLIMQEFYTSFELGVEGSYYAKYIDKLKLKGMIGNVPYEESFKVYTAWDLGVRDSSVIIFFQIIGQTVKIFDYYSNEKVGLPHYAKILEQKGYNYAKHIAPHDIAVQEFSSGQTRIEIAKQLGINFTVAPKLAIEDGIEAVRAAFSKIWIDEKNCAPLIKALENYRQEYDPKKRTYKSMPLHDWSSHAADAMRYLCITLPKMRTNSDPEALEKRYQEAMYGDSMNMPSVFRTDLPRY